MWGGGIVLVVVGGVGRGGRYVGGISGLDLVCMVCMAWFQLEIEEHRSESGRALG